ncbi:pyridoxamine 5'-phosphate oxidase family protein [Kineosporia sp. J2-2]|uniref:Pyridoxamine 5'-phosphate oxidase family protein n=1 Tax=Kineosporia corallincola TaxID=2835133 RepID=A0ABS5TIG0_9ACTN|nr:MSMEG_1061 family FMN-dependent PPOX-type flavoprotein [Kineosporia corallincola]MBT0770884.1 pyridoxamine 5'-phosphate oxidase family protein [Kineosporia corallincola]
MSRVITNEAELREIVEPPHPDIESKAVGRIDPASRRFIELSPFFLLATTAQDGTCDVSPRGDPAGNVLVLDEKTIAFGDRKGNRRLDSLRNILSSPRVGMLFVVPGISDTIRVNGMARIVADAPYLDRMSVRGSVPHLSIEVSVEELFSHCSKAFVRSRMWDVASWPERRDVPTGGQIAKSQRELAVEAELIDDMLALDAEHGLY